MTTARKGSVCRVLEEDQELAEAIPPDRRALAVRECLARTLFVPKGRWRAPDAVPPSEGIGLLVLGGLLIRRVGVDGKFGAELLGSGDLLRPWQGEEEPAMLATTSRWRVIEATRLAVLDEAFTARLVRFPQLTGQLVARALARSRNLAVNMAIVHHPRVDLRLHMLLWNLAARWGRVHADCVVVPLRLTHEVLSDLVAARRPTVTTALSELAKRGLVQADSRGWLLAGEPPGELVELGAVARSPNRAAVPHRAGPRLPDDPSPSRER